MRQRRESGIRVEETGEVQPESMSSTTSAGSRWLLAGAVLLFINGFFVAKVPDATRPELAFVSSAFVIVLAGPSFLAYLRWLGWKRGCLGLVCLGTFAVAIETFA